MNNKVKRLLIVIISIILLVIIDRITKIWAEATLIKGNIELIPGMLRFELLPGGNNGAAWGMLSGHQLLFIIIASLVCIMLLFIIYNMPFEKKLYPIIVFMTLIISGGIGNMIDRAFIGTVTDFISFYIINFPIFNVADMYVSVATVVFIIMFLFYYSDDDLKSIENSVKSVFRK